MLVSDIDNNRRSSRSRSNNAGLLILKILALEPMHGWALAQRLKQMSKDVLQVGPGSLYPALHKWNKKAGLPPNIDKATRDVV